MPQFERYPDESPVAARQRIAKNRATANGGRGGGRPAAPPIGSEASTLSPNKAKLAEDLNAVVAGAVEKPRLKSGMMSKGYNFTKNLGGDDLPDVGY